jgi:hypothetical protein
MEEPMEMAGEEGGRGAAVEGGEEAVEEMSLEATEDTAAHPTFKPAPSFPLPSRSLVCVEHPAHVRDVQRAITTLGGLSALTKVLPLPSSSIPRYVAC